MNASQLTWAVFGLAVGAGAAWTMRPAEDPAKVSAPVEAAVERVAKQTPKPVRVVPKKTRVEEEALAPVALKARAPDVGACGAHALVATDVIAHVSAKGVNRRITVTATPRSEALSECVRGQITHAALEPFDGVQTFRYSFAPR